MNYGIRGTIQLLETTIFFYWPIIFVAQYFKLKNLYLAQNFPFSLPLVSNFPKNCYSLLYRVTTYQEGRKNPWRNGDFNLEAPPPSSLPKISNFKHNNNKNSDKEEPR